MTRDEADRKLVFLFSTAGMSQAEIVAKGVRLLREQKLLKEPRPPQQLRLPFRPTLHQLVHSAMAVDSMMGFGFRVVGNAAQPVDTDRHR